MKKIIVLITALFLISGCAYIGEVCKQFLPAEFCNIFTCIFGEEGINNMMNNMEIRKFLQAHPNAEITIDLIPRQNVLKKMNALTMELGTKPEIKDYLKLELKSDEESLIVFVDANTKKLNYVRLETGRPVESEIIDIPIPIPNEPWYMPGRIYRIHGEIYTYDELSAFSILAEEDIGDTIARWDSAGYPQTLRIFIETLFSQNKIDACCDNMDDICGDDFIRMCELTCPEIKPANEPTTRQIIRKGDKCLNVFTKVWSDC